MKIIKTNTNNQNSITRQAVRALKNNGLIIYPTETCYGIGADATSQIAVNKLLKYKGQRRNKPVSIAVISKKMAEQYVSLNDSAQNIYHNFLPGPITVISQSKGKTVKSIESANHTLGIRIPNHPLATKIISQSNKPITATSANSSGKKTPYSIQDILKYTSKKKLELVDLIIDAGKLEKHPTSTVVDTTLQEPEIIRQGEIDLSKSKNISFTSMSENNTQQIAATILEKYYSANKHKPVIFALQGELGSGKTQFVKGIAKKLGIPNNIPSPTYILIREYPHSFSNQKGTLYHIDTWRMETGNELQQLGLEKMLKNHNIIAIEWLQKVKPLLNKLHNKAKIIWVDIESLSPNKRKITISS